MATASADYRLTGPAARQAVARGLAEAEWYRSPVPRDIMHALLERRDGPALRDTLLWFALLAGTGWAGWMLWGSWWAVAPFVAYGVLYASSSDSRWHEAGHGTAFRTGWLNDLLYEIASFMVMRESTPWRWSHSRHHSDTIIVGRDPEIAVPRPPDLVGLLLGFLCVPVILRYFPRVIRHSLGRIDADERTYIPPSEFPAVVFKARIYLLIYLGIVAVALATRSLLPLMYIGLPTLYGSWLMPIYGLTQHAGLAEDVLDHRLNCRTVIMGPINRFLYWNMNYHVEHHMFPLVPYHALPRLHAAVRADMPPPYAGIIAAYCEIIPALWRQRRDPSWHVQRPLPIPAPAVDAMCAPLAQEADADGWLATVPAHRLGRGRALRCDHGRRTFAIYRTEDGACFASDGMCTHGSSHLADGLVLGRQIECPKHNGRFDLADGRPARPPVCRALRTYPAEEREGVIRIRIGTEPAPAPVTDAALWVVANRRLAPFITELVLEPAAGPLPFVPGDHVEFAIPDYGSIDFRALEVPASMAALWERNGVAALQARHPGGARRATYSIASGPAERGLRFAVRLALPPLGSSAPPGVASAWMFSLRPGAVVMAAPPRGDFHIRGGEREMVYIGGGAGVAPIRSHLLHLLGDRPSPRRINFWFGARTARDLVYRDDFARLAERHASFTFHPVLSDPAMDEAWPGPTGMVHEAVRSGLLAGHPRLRSLEFYLCGPPRMVEACTAMLDQLGVAPCQVICDAFT